MQKRILDVVVLSDIHLGTYGCHAKELVNYLKSISPKLLVLNGDIIDAWQFNKRYFPLTHVQVIKEVMSLLSKGTQVVYITGNHDEMLRRYSNIQIGDFLLTDKLVLDINGQKTWIFHGDVFDTTTKGSAKIFAKLGGKGYDILILINRGINKILSLIGKERMSFSKKVKNSVKKAVSWIQNFEQTAAELAIENKYDYVICGHIHQPQKKFITTKNGNVTYLNSGDWIENLTALELKNGDWNIYHYEEIQFQNFKSLVIPIQKKMPTINVLTDEVEIFIQSVMQ